MKLRDRAWNEMNKASVLVSLAMSACSGGPQDTGDKAAVATAEAPIIAGVDAKSPTLNAVGSLVQIYRYTGRNCWWVDGGTGGASSTGTGMPKVTRSARERHGHLDAWTPLPPAPKGTQSVMASYGTNAIGGAPSSGGASGYGGATGYVTSTKASGGFTSIPTTCVIQEIVEYYPFCTGTLVGPTAVQTAKHCLMNLDLYSDVEVGFAVGPDAYEPTAVYPIVDWEWETEVTGDPYSILSDLGSDVGVAHLGTPVSGVTPMVIGTLTASDIGKRFAALGYGDQNNYEVHGTRKAGSLTLRGIGGNYADYVFGSLEGFLAGAKNMPDFAGLPEDYLIRIYNELWLLPEYQAFLGGRPGDAQPCYGDSGGPLITVRNGVRTVFGTVTSGFPSNRLLCDFGAVFAVFGPATQTFLQNALQWVDPCEGVSVKGYCSGDLAIRCTDRSEGTRRLSETDCGLLGQTCGLDEDGAAACVDPM